jgi:hypothetical protein
MRTRLALLCGLVLVLLSSRASQAQVVVNPLQAACGAGNEQFDVRTDNPPPTLPPLDPTRARVYFLSTMPDEPFISKIVRLGIDGSWLGAVGPASYTVHDLAPGTHHLCASYQGKALLSEPAQRLLQLHLQPGKTYFVVYRAIIIRDQGLIAFLEQVDDDQGSFVLQQSTYATATPKK